jgi:hypothetical protein
MFGLFWWANRHHACFYHLFGGQGRFFRLNQKLLAAGLLFLGNFCTNFCQTKDELRFIWLHALSQVFASHLYKAILSVKICIQLSEAHLQGNPIILQERLRRFGSYLDCKKVEDRWVTRKEGLPCSKSQLDKYDRLWIVRNLLKNHFWRHILWTSTERIGEFSFKHVRFGQSKISDFHMSIFSQQYVLRLDISIDNVTLVKIAQT